MGGFGNIARTIGGIGNEAATATFVNQDRATQAAADKLKLLQLGLQNQKLQQELQPQGGVSKDTLRARLTGLLNNPEATPQDKRVYTQLLYDTDSGQYEQAAQNLDKYEMNRAEKSGDVIKQFSDALSRGDQVEMSRLAPLVKQYKETTEAPTKPEVPLGASRVAQLNQALAARYRANNPGKSLPSQYTLQPNATQKDFDNIDKIMQQSETAGATAANREQTAEFRKMTMSLSGLGAPAGNINLSGDDYLQSLPATERMLVTQIGTGRMAPERISYILTRNPKLMSEVSLAYPDFDSSKVESYISTYKDFTSGPASIAINAGNTALLHLHELKQLNTDKSRILGTADYQRYQNKLDTIASELGRFYGNTTLEGIASYRRTLGAFFNRNAAIQTQAQSMGDKLDAFENQWKNAAPSAAYQAPLPGISDAAKKARAALDPNYKYISSQAGGDQVFATPPRASKPGMKWQQNSRTGEFREVPER